ncbi:hypothetical protein QZH44_29935 (plasmid) [Pseudomonas corrugata]|uniref:hypothetical protein n=1 Tax=Pseudomonas corrugata TaxID=47879 RepID=UPI003D814FC9
MGFVIKSSGLLLVVIGGQIGAIGEFRPGHSGRVLTYVGMCLMCFGVVTALVSATFDRSK